MNTANQLANIAPRLKALPNWLAWKLTDKGKEPFIVGTNRHAKANDPSTWAPFELAASSVAPNGKQGIGFAPGTSGIVGIDIDGCRDPETGEIAPWADEILDALSLDTNVEVTPSETGVRAWVTGVLPSDERVFKLDPSVGYGDKVQVELLGEGRYGTVTGNPLYESPGDVEPCDLATVCNLLKSLTLKYPAVPKTNQSKHEASTSAPSSYESVPVKNDHGPVDTTKFELLMRADISGDKPFHIEDDRGNYLTYPDRSAADMALFTVSAIHHIGDPDPQAIPEAILADYRSSVIFREEEWGHRSDDLLRITIPKAIKSAEKFTEIKSVSKPQTKSDGSGRSLGTRRASKIKTKNIIWLWPNRIPFGKLSVVAGNPDQGKSLVTMYIAAHLSTGRALYGCTTALPPCDVLVLAGEDDAADTIVPRLQVMGADLDRIHIAESITVTNGKGETIEQREAQLDTDISSVEAILNDNPEIRPIVIDPISNYLGNANMNREQEIRGVLIPLKSLAERTGVAIISVMHLNKNSDASAIHRIGGAMAFSGVARAAWMFVADPNDRETHMMLRIKGNIAKSVGGLTYRIGSQPITIEDKLTEQPVVEWTGVTDTCADDLITDTVKRGRPPEQRDVAKDWLFEFLSSGEQTVSDVQFFGKKEKHTWATLRRASNELKVERYQTERKWFWRLPPSEQTEQALEVGV